MTDEPEMIPDEIALKLAVAMFQNAPDLHTLERRGRFWAEANDVRAECKPLAREAYKQRLAELKARF